MKAKPDRIYKKARNVSTHLEILLIIPNFSDSWQKYLRFFIHSRINLSPFTKDFRVWGTPTESYPIFLRQLKLPILIYFYHHSAMLLKNGTPIIRKVQRLCLRAVKNANIDLWAKIENQDKVATFDYCICQRPYHAEHTSSRPITEVKQHWAQSVLGWVTAWEHWVLLAFHFFLEYFENYKNMWFIGNLWQFLGIFYGFRHPCYFPKFEPLQHVPHFSVQDEMKSSKGTSAYASPH